MQRQPMRAAARLLVLLALASSAGLARGRPFSGWDRKAGVCAREQFPAKPGCGYRCPTNACARPGATCLRSFDDCICQPGYYAPMKYPSFNTYDSRGSHKGRGEAVRLRNKVKDLGRGVLGHCVYGQGRSSATGSRGHPQYMKP